MNLKSKVGLLPMNGNRLIYLPSPTITVALEFAASTKELIPLDVGTLEIDLICRIAFSTIYKSIES